MMQFYSFNVIIRFCVVSVLFVGYLPTALGQAQGPDNIWFVDPDAPSGGDGESWNSAFHHPLEAIDNALNLPTQTHEIRIAGGHTYVPTTTNTNQRTAHFLIPRKTVIRGGYAGYGENNPNLNSPEQFPTILSGDRLGNDGANFANNGDNVYHVLEASGLNADNASSLENLIIEGGNADIPFGRGGGIKLASSDGLTLRGCIVRNNFALSNGGGIVVEGGALTIRDSEITGNYSDVGAGGGIWLEGTEFRLLNSTVSANRAQSSGGGLTIIAIDAALIISSTITNNLVEDGFDAGEGRGGGLYIQGGTACPCTNTVAVINSVIANNHCEKTEANCDNVNGSANYGGGAVIFAEHPFIMGNTIVNNTAGRADSDCCALGGGLFL